MSSIKKCLTFVTVLFFVVSSMSVSSNTTSGTISSPQKIESGIDPGAYPFKQQYLSYQQLDNWSDNLVDENSNITKKIHIGESWEGRDIWAIKVSDDVKKEQDEPSVLIEANIHAREWSSHQVATYYLWKLVEDYGSNETITWLVNNRQIYVIPMVNPDGYIYDGNGDLSQAENWRKNRNASTPTSSVGVDLNRNWDIAWNEGVDDPTSNTYHGEAPFSEKETDSIRDFILSKDIDSYNDIHSYAGTLLIPWAHTTNSSVHDSWYRDMADDMTSLTSLLGDNSQHYSYGQPDEEIGYTAPGGAYDWVYEETGAIGLSYEIYTGASGFYPSEDKIMDINKDLYDSLVYQARIANLDLGNGTNDLHPSDPYIVYGNVSDNGGAPVIGKNVTIENMDTGETIYVNTGQNGYYESNFGNFDDKGYDSSDTFSIQAGNVSKNFTIDGSWGQRKDLKGVKADPPSVNLTNPTRGGSWSVGENLSIEWKTDQGDAPITSIDLEYTTSEKDNWSILAEEIEDTGNYNWTIPGVPTSEAKIRITVHDKNDMKDTDISGLFNITFDNVPEVPNWGIGSNWTYDQDIWMDKEDGDWLRMNESITYKVTDIGNHEYNGSTYYSYNLSLKGDIKDGEGKFDGYPIEIESGKIEGFMLVRVSDLGVIVDHQYREIDGYVEGDYGEPPFDAFVNLTRYYQTVVEEFDFPLWRDETFWSNTTIETFGDYKFEDGSGLISEEKKFNETEKIYQTNTVSDELKEVEVPAGNYTTYEANTSMENNTSQLGNMKNWYNETVGWFVKQNLIFPSSDLQCDIVRELNDSALKTPGHKQEVYPNPQNIGSNITLSGHMEGYPNTNLSIYIPYSLGKQNWKVKTDSDGNYELNIQVPNIKDNTPTNSYYSSGGIITSVEGEKSEKIVTTLLTIRDSFYLEIDSTEGGKILKPGEGKFTYDYGDEVELLAEADEDYNFVGWTGDIEQIENSESNKTTIDMLNDYSISAEFEKVEEYDLTINVDGSGTTDPTEGVHTYKEKEKVTVVASSENHWYFEGWLGDVSGGKESKKITVTMDEDKSLTALFKEHRYTIDVTVEGNGSVDIAPDQEYYEPSTNVTLTADPDENWSFEEWTGDVPEGEKGEEITVTMDEDKSLTAHFEELDEYSLEIMKEGNGNTDPAEGTHTYYDGEEINITVYPDENWSFKEWTGDVPDGQVGKEITVTMDEDKSLTAHFEELEKYSLEITKEGEGNTDPAEGTHTYYDGEEINITVYLDENWSFKEWTGDVPEGEKGEEITVTMDENKSLTAHFEELKAEFKSDSFNVNIDGLEVNVTAELRNIGDIEGTTQLKVAGKVIENITLKPGEREVVEHTYEFEEEGEYTIELGDQSKTVNVEAKGNEEGIRGFTSVLFLSAAAIAVAIYKKWNGEV